MKAERKKYILDNIGKKSIREIARELGMKERHIRNVIEAEAPQQRKDAASSAVEQPVSGIPIDRDIAAPNKNFAVFWAVALIICLGFAAYGNSVGGKFFRDDIDLVRDNAYIRSAPAVMKFLTSNIAIGTGMKWNSYRPVQMVTYALDYRIWRLNPGGYHLTNILLHILVALCIYWFISLLFNDALLSFAASALFVVHPVHGEAVSSISSRATPLCALFMLLAFIFYIKGMQTKRLSYYLLMVLAYAVSLFSRESSLFLIALILLYHFTWKKKLEPARVITILGMALFYVLLRVTALKSTLSNISYSTTLFQRIPGFFMAITEYTRIMLLPFNLHSFYGVKVFSPADPKVVLGALITVSLLAFAFRKKRTDNLIFFSVCWFFIALLPNSNLYPINAYMSESWLYLPSIGFFLILAGGLASLYRIKRFRIMALSVFIILTASGIYLTFRQNADYWREPIAFYKKTLEYEPDNYGEYNNLGIAYYETGKKEEAIAAFKKAMELKPDFAKPFYNLGTVYYSMNRKAEAVVLFEKAAGADPRYTEAYLNLGSAYYAVGKKEEAIAAYKRALELEPGEKTACYNLGLVYFDINRPAESIPLFKKAIGLKPDFAEAYYALGRAYDSVGKRGEALAAYKKAGEINPSYSVVPRREEAPK